MTREELYKSLPHELEAALRRQDFDALLTAAEGLGAGDEDTMCLALWRIAAQLRTAPVEGILSYCLVRRFSGAVAEGSRLWLLVNGSEDLSTLVNTLSGLQVSAVERGGISEVHHGVLPAFLLRCLSHESEAVRISVLDFLRDYLIVHGGFPPRFGSVGARRLADRLNERLMDLVRDEERDELAGVTRALRSDKIPPRPSIKVTPFNSLVEQLNDVAEATELAAFARYRRLLEHALWQARQAKRPVITVRVVARGRDAFMSRVQDVVDLCRMQHSDQTQHVWLAAPAASSPKHLSANAGTTADVFDRFRRAARVITEGQLDAPVTAFADLPPRQAAALADLLLEAGESNVSAEFILTQPEVATRQEPLLLEMSPEDALATTLAATADAARLAAARAPEVYSDEIPQANVVKEVLDAVVAVIERGEVTLEDFPGVTEPRHVAYYKNAARVLRFLDDENQPTPRGLELHNKSPEAQMALAAIAFDESALGRAWCAWAAKEHLVDVDADTAVTFLAARAVGITGTTIPRRASTVRKWHQELSTFFRRG